MISSRYARQVLLPGVGAAGQERLQRSRVVVIGAGGLGAPVLNYLAAAGVGTMNVIDDDVVELSNLQRQVLFRTGDLGRPKAQVAAERLRELNPEVTVHEQQIRVDEANVDALIDGADVVLDGTDNFATRYLVNDACVRATVPLVWGSILRFDGQVAVWWAGRGPCYRCVFARQPEPDEVPSCSQAGVLGPVAATIGALQATEALKVLLGVGEPLVGRILVYDALAGTTETLPVRADPQCISCGTPAHPASAARSPEPEGRGTTDRHDPAEVETCSPVEAARRLREEEIWLIDVRGPDERQLASLPQAVPIPLADLLSGAADPVLPTGRPLVVMCATGVRSAQAVRALTTRGHQATSLAGGIAAWSREVDPRVPRY